MERDHTSTFTKALKLLSWFFAALFLVIGVLNAVLIHIVPGVFYILLSLIYLPQVHTYSKEWFGFSIPLVVRILIGLVVLWGTLAVGDLAELLGL